MAIKVLVVDDSSFFRRRVSEMIDSDSRLKVIDIATNGKDAIEKTKTLKPDVITMDIEMPIMDGITAVKEIMAVAPTPILMFSALTHEGATATLDALEAGALDFLPKKFEDIAKNRDEAVELLQQRVIQIASKRLTVRHSPGITETKKVTPVSTPAAPTKLIKSAKQVQPSKSSKPASNSTPSGKFRATGKKYQLTAIGSSTGGPVALQKVLMGLPVNYPHPILLIQHMPATFTAAFAERLNSLCKIEVKEAQDGDVLRHGVAYLAPGGKQMVVEGRGGGSRLRVMDGGERMNYKPCVDVTFGSAAKAFGDKVLSMVLTGMGADGREGARMLKSAGSTIWAQDEETCVVYGMPQAVAKAGLSSEDLPIGRIAERMLIEVGLA